MGYLIQKNSDDPDGHGDDPLLIENMVIIGTGVDPNCLPENSNQGGFYIYSVRGSNAEITMRNVIVKDVNGWGIQIKGFKKITIENCYVVNGNFYAYTICAGEVYMENCHAVNYPAFLEGFCASVWGNDTLWTYYMRHCTATGLQQAFVHYGNGRIFFIDVDFKYDPDIDWDGVHFGMGTAGFCEGYWDTFSTTRKILLSKINIEDPEYGITFSAGLYDNRVPMQTAFINKYTYSNIYTGRAVWRVMDEYLTNLIWKT
jgi:hypothetical protein